jgi:translation initiation factor IF-3
LAQFCWAYPRRGLLAVSNGYQRLHMFCFDAACRGGNNHRVSQGFTAGFLGASAISQHGLRCNEQIRIAKVRLINEDNTQAGIVPTIEAMRLAREAGLDLVEVSPQADPPVCRIMDYGKWKYKQRKKEQKSHATPHQQLKELRIRSVKIDHHDQVTTLNKAKKFLEDGHKVQFNLMFRGREMHHVDLGRQILDRFRTDLETLSKVEREPRLEGKRMILILTPKRG